MVIFLIHHTKSYSETLPSSISGMIFVPSSLSFEQLFLRTSVVVVRLLSRPLPLLLVLVLVQCSSRRRPRSCGPLSTQASHYWRRWPASPPLPIGSSVSSRSSVGFQSMDYWSTTLTNDSFISFGILLFPRLIVRLIWDWSWDWSLDVACFWWINIDFVP